MSETPARKQHPPDRLAALYETALRSNRDRVRSLESALHAAAWPLDPDVRAAAVAAAHDIAGSAGTFGRPSASATAAELEIALKDDPSGGDRIRALVARLREDLS